MHVLCIATTTERRIAIVDKMLMSIFVFSRLITPSSCKARFVVQEIDIDKRSNTFEPRNVPHTAVSFRKSTHQ